MLMLSLMFCHPYGTLTTVLLATTWSGHTNWLSASVASRGWDISIQIWKCNSHFVFFSFVPHTIAVRVWCAGICLLIFCFCFSLICNLHWLNVGFNPKTLIMLFEVFYTSWKIILPWFCKVFILQFIITVGITLVDSAKKIYTCFITLKYSDNWKQFQTRDNLFIRYNLNFFVILRFNASLYEPQSLYPLATCGSLVEVCPPLL